MIDRLRFVGASLLTSALVVGCTSDIADPPTLARASHTVAASTPAPSAPSAAEAAAAARSSAPAPAMGDVPFAATHAARTQTPDEQARVACGTPACGGAESLLGQFAQITALKSAAAGKDVDLAALEDLAGGGCGCSSLTPDGHVLLVTCTGDDCTCSDEKGAVGKVGIPNVCGAQASMEAAFTKCCLN